MFLSAAPYLDYSQGGEGERCGKISRPSESIICRRHAARKSQGRGKGGWASWGGGLVAGQEEPRPWERTGKSSARRSSNATSLMIKRKYDTDTFKVCKPCLPRLGIEKTSGGTASGRRCSQDA